MFMPGIVLFWPAEGAAGIGIFMPGMALPWPAEGICIIAIFWQQLQPDLLPPPCAAPAAGAAALPPHIPALAVFGDGVAVACTWPPPHIWAEA
jgi:hypothetical protein